MIGINLQQITMWCLFLVPFLMLHATLDAKVAYGKVPFYDKDTNTTFDWRTRGVISAVALQNNFISAWDEVIRESIESLHAIQTGKLLNLSTEEVHDCCSSIPSYQCVVNLGGLCSAASYKNGTGSCQKGSCSIVAKVTGWTEMAPNNEDLMVKAIRTTPLMAGMNANSIATYTSGIYDDPNCREDPNHYVQLVGYGSQDGKDFWIARNSWGPIWGMQGYMYLSRGNNMCGIASNVSYPVNQ